MPNCSVCGTPMTDSGVCPNCGSQTAAQAPNSAYGQGSVMPPPPPPPPAPPGYPPQQPPYQGQGYPPPQQGGYPPPQQGYPPPPQQGGYPPQQGGYPPQQGGYPPNYGYAPAPMNPIIADSVSAIKRFFSADPQPAVDTAVNSRAHVWVVLALLNILFVGLAAMLVPAGIIRGAIGGFGVSVGDVLPLGSLFGGGVLTSAVSFIVFAACLKGVYAVYRQNIPFVTVMNLLSSALIISTVAYAAAVIFSFIYTELAMLVISFGAIGSILMLYSGFNKAARFEKSPLWGFLIAYIVNVIAISICITQLLGSAIESLL